MKSFLKNFAYWRVWWCHLIPSVYVLNPVYWFAYTESSLPSWGETTWSGYLIFLMINCSVCATILVGDIFIYSLMRLLVVYLLVGLFSRFGIRVNDSVHTWVWKYSFPFSFIDHLRMTSVLSSWKTSYTIEWLIFQGVCSS